MARSLNLIQYHNIDREVQERLKQKKKRNAQVERERFQEYLLSKFPNKERYCELVDGDFVLVLAINGETKKPYVALYTKDSFEAYKYFHRAKSGQGKLL